jgi:saccharopine dehydrogenase-like NADP-dependent oxidoreductase
VDFPSGVKTATLDYADHQQLVDLLSKHDVVIEAFNPAAASLQGAIVDAALEAGIKHLITPDCRKPFLEPTVFIVLIPSS